jgi:prepilin-type N-terminal cleavage/methylation domain-containing protein
MPTSTTGKSNSGFTLLELIVVVTLIALTLAVVLPNFQGALLSDPVRDCTRWLMLTARQLRAQAVQSQQAMALHIDLDTGRMWGAPAGPETPKPDAGPNQTYRVPPSLTVLDVEYPAQDRRHAGTAVIRFFPQGYSDPAIIHLESGAQRRLSLQIEMFLPDARLREGYVSFDG